MWETKWERSDIKRRSMKHAKGKKKEEEEKK